jgi:hypothetical protein
MAENVAKEENPPDALPTSVVIVDGTNMENQCRECFGTEEIHFANFFAKPRLAPD